MYGTAVQQWTGTGVIRTVARGKYSSRIIISAQHSDYRSFTAAVRRLTDFFHVHLPLHDVRTSTSTSIPLAVLFACAVRKYSTVLMVRLD